MPSRKTISVHSTNTNTETAAGTILTPLLTMALKTPLNLTVQHPAVIALWQTLTMAADGLLGLFVLLGVIYILLADMTGSLRLSLGQFLGKAALTALLIHLSAFLGTLLLQINNALCDLFPTTIINFILQLNHGQFFSDKRILALAIILVLVFGISLFRFLYLALRRLILLNVLHVLGGLAALTTCHPLSMPIFSGWFRLYLITIFEQMLMDLTLTLGFQFLIATKQTGLIGFLLAIVMLNLTVEIPKLLARFGAAPAHGSGNPLGTVISMTSKAAMMFV